MIRRLWPLLIGFALWSAAFVGLYALQYFGCHFGWAPMAHRIALLVGYAIALASLAGVLVLQVGRTRQLMAATAVDKIGVGVTIAALAAVAITFAPTLLASACV